MKRLLAATAALFIVALVFFTSHSGRLPETAGEWGGLAIGAAALLLVIGALATIRVAASRLK
jgi:hypothetical protein